MRWIETPFNAESVQRLERELHLSPLIARLLVQRGIDEPAAADAYLHPSLSQLHSRN